MAPQEFRIEPPLLNSACPWATTVEGLTALYNCRHTGAVTIRTSLIDGFKHDDSVHQYAFFSPSSCLLLSTSREPLSSTPSTVASSINSLGYSPIPLMRYLLQIEQAAYGAIPNWTPRIDKAIIISVTGSAEQVAICYSQISRLQAKFPEQLKLYMEINLSCPNIPEKQPPAYDEGELLAYLVKLANEKENEKNGGCLVGIKTPPYTYQGQFNGLISALKKSSAGLGGCPIAFITATNTLGSSLLLNESLEPAINNATGSGIGGMAGASLHSLSLGNVATTKAR